MGINIAICETESPVAPCREAKLARVAAHVPPGAFEDLQGRDEVVSLEDAAAAVGDMDAFFKRNRINPESDAVYMDKVKKDEDRALLAPYARSVPTGWVDLTLLGPEKAEEVYEASIKEDAVTAWMRVEFDEMSETCAKCPLSWDKGRGCMGSFGPDNSRLPEIAEKAGCPIVASVPESVRTGRRFPKEDVPALMKEVEALRPALAADSKMAVHRYGGVLDRLQAAAEACMKGECGFYFFRSRRGSLPSADPQLPHHIGREVAHPFHRLHVVLVLGGVQRPEHGQRAGPADGHPVLQHPCDQLPVGALAPVVGGDRDGAPDLPGQSPVAHGEGELRPLEEEPHDPRRGPGVGGGREHHRVRGPELVEDLVEPVVLVRAAAVAAHLAGAAVVAGREAVGVQLYLLGLEALAVEIVQEVGQYVAGVADHAGAAVESHDLHAPEIREGG